MRVNTLLSLDDNYIYFIETDSGAICVDPSEAQPVLDHLEGKEIKHLDILITHHHQDHIGGITALKESLDCTVIGPDKERIAEQDTDVEGGQTLAIDSLNFKVYALPGHTSTHVAFYEPQLGWLFCGDTLFAGGCGRLFEGSPEEMLGSLKTLMKLRDDTQIFCGHEYTQKNLEFALSLEPENKAVFNRLEMVKKLRERGLPSVPFSMCEEKRTNPFLRVHEDGLKRAVDMGRYSDLEVFTYIRNQRRAF